MGRMRRSLFAGTLAALALAASTPAAGPTLSFSTFAVTGLPLGQVVSTGSGFLYLTENSAEVDAVDATGAGMHPFATFPGTLGGEEARCVVPVIAYWPDGIYCHLPDNGIYRIARNGSSMALIAQLPGSVPSDGALAFDSSGKFGYALLAATGGSASNGGEVYAVRRDGRVQDIGGYPGPGGADEIAIAPSRFGPASGRLLISIDEDSKSGRVLAIDRMGNVSVVASGLGNGDNPIVAIPPAPKTRAAGSPAAGLYVPDTNSTAVYFVGADVLAPYAGQVLVGSELGADFWLIAPNRAGTGFVTRQLTAVLPDGSPNLEGAAYVP
jgi:hypothetical protein